MIHMLLQLVFLKGLLLCIFPNLSTSLTNSLIIRFSSKSLSIPRFAALKKLQRLENNIYSTLCVNSVAVVTIFQ
jgi:hypothetical protein